MFEPVGVEDGDAGSADGTGEHDLPGADGRHDLARSGGVLQAAVAGGVRVGGGRNSSITGASTGGT